MENRTGAAEQISDASILQWQPLVAVITVVGAILRFYQLGEESLWLDESFTFYRMDAGWWDMLQHCYAGGQGPFYLVLTRPFAEIAGTSEFALRFPSAVFGTCCIPMIYALGKALWNARIGLLAAWFLAINPYAILYSQEARAYALLLLLTMGSYLFFLHVLRRSGNSTCNTLAYISFTILALYTHPYGVFLLASQLLIIAVLESSGELRGSEIGIMKRYWPLIAIGVLYTPQFLFWAMLYVPGDEIFAWIQRPTVWDSLWILAAHWGSVPLAITAWTLIAGIGIWQFRSCWRERGTLFFAAVSLSFLGVPILMSSIGRPMLNHRYVTPMLPFTTIALCVAISYLGTRLRVTSVLVVSTLATLAVYDMYRQTNKEPWKQLAARLQTELRPGDVVVPSVSYEFDAVRYYVAKDQNGVRVEKINPDDSAALARTLDTADRLWILCGYGDLATWHRRLDFNKSPVATIFLPRQGDARLYFAANELRAVCFETGGVDHVAQANERVKR